VHDILPMPFRERTKFQVKEAANNKCCICQTPGVEIHHIIPQSEGGPDTFENAAPLCPTCHSIYGGNPIKRKAIREARDIWYQKCKNMYSSSVSNSLSDTATQAIAQIQTSEIELTFNRDFESFTIDDRNKLAKVIRELLDLDKELNIKIRKGSVIATIELRSDLAIKLKHLIEIGALDQYDITRIELMHKGLSTSQQSAASNYAHKSSPTTINVDNEIRNLYRIQLFDSRIDQIEILISALSIELRVLEDEILGIERRMVNNMESLDELKINISRHKVSIKESEQLIEGFEKQLKDVNSDLEYNSIYKEIELLKLGIQISERMAMMNLDKLKKTLAGSKKSKSDKIDQKKKVLADKKIELEKILIITEKERALLTESSAVISGKVEKRLLSSYQRIRRRYKNGLAVVDIINKCACRGCFNRAPPIVQDEVRKGSKVLACEHCGRIFIAGYIAREVELEMQRKFNIPL